MHPTPQINRSLPDVLLTWLYALSLIFILSIPTTLGLQTFRYEGHWTLEAWKTLAGDWQRWSQLLTNSFIVCTSALLVAIFLGTILAVIIFKIDWPGRSLAVAAIFLLACLPGYVLSTSLLSLFQLPFWLESAWLAGCIHGLMYVPLCTILIGLGLLQVDSRLEESARLDVPDIPIFFHITLPQSGWSLLATALLVFTLTFTDYSVTDILTVRTFAEEIYTQYQLQGDRTTPFLLALPMMLLIVIACVILSPPIKNLTKPAHQPFHPKPLLAQLHPRYSKMAGIMVLAIIAVCFFPLLHLSQKIESTNRFRLAFESFLPEWQTTVKVTCLTGLLMAPLTIHFGWLIAKSSRWKIPFLLALLFLLSIPAPSLAMVLINLINRVTPAFILTALSAIGITQDPLQYFSNSIFILVLVIGLRFLPLATLLVLPAIQRLPQELDQAVCLDGAGHWQTIHHLYWPNCWVAAGLAGLATIIWTTGELACSYLIAPPGQATLSIRLFTFIHYGLNAEVATVCLVATLTILTPAMTLFLITRKKLLGR